MDYQEAIEYLEHRKKLEAMPLSPMLEGKTAHVEVYEIAVFAMQELQLYKDGKLCLVPDDVYAKQCAELDEYKRLGTLEELKQLKELEFTALEMADIACALNLLQKYEQLGTLEDVRAAVEEQKEKAPEVLINDHDVKIGNLTYKKGVRTYKRGRCRSFISRSYKYCPECGAKIDWSVSEC